MNAKHPKPEPEKLNTEPAAKLELSEEFSLEDIMNEFGGWTKRESPVSAEPKPEAPAAPAPAEPAPEPDTAEKPETPREAAEDVRISEPQPQPAEKKPDLSSQTLRFAPVEAEPAPKSGRVWSYEAEPAPQPGSEENAARREKRQAAQELRRRRRMERARARQTRKKQRRQEQPEHVFQDAAEAYRFYQKQGALPLRLLGVSILCVLSVILLVLSTQTVFGIDRRAGAGPMSAVMLAAMLLELLLCYDVLAEGLLQLLRLRFDHSSMLLTLCVVTAVDALFALSQNRVPFCTAAGLELAAALWQKQMTRTSRRKALKAVCSMPEPFAAVREEKAWHGMDCIFRGSGSTDEYARQLELPDAGKRIMRVYAPIVTVLTLCLSVLSSLRSEENLLWAWACMLLAAYPTGLLIAFCRPFAIHAGSLARSGAAVAGWQGARTLAGECCLAVEDADLFPPSNVTLNGMKLYTDRLPSQIIGYASAVVEAAGSGLLPLFDEMMRNQNGKHYTVDTFRRYEGGGLGAEIRGDVILMGSNGFMKLMRVRMPDGTKLKQAVYLSVNGELAAVFALTYAPADAARSALASVVRCRKLTPILATRDFMITPQFLHQRYKLPQDRVEFPTVEERAHLSAPEAIRDGRQGALLARRSFLSFSQAVTLARAMRRSAIGCMVIAVFGGLFGAGLLFLMTFIGSSLAASAWNLFLYVLLWFLPCWLITGLSGRI